MIATDGNREFTATTDANGDYELFLAAGDYVVTPGRSATRATARAGHDRDRPDDQSGLQPAALPRFTVSGHVTAVRGRQPDRGRHGPCASVHRSPRPRLTRPAPTASSCRSATSRSGRRSAAAPRVVSSDISLVGPDLVPRLLAVPQARRLRSRLPRRSRSPGSTRPASRPCSATSSPVASACHSPSRSMARSTPVYLSDNGYLNFLASISSTTSRSGSRRASAPNAAIYPLWQDLVLDAEADRLRHDRDRPDRTFVIEYSACAPSARAGADVRGPALRGRPDRPPLRRTRPTRVTVATPDRHRERRPARMPSSSFLEARSIRTARSAIEPVPSGPVHGPVTDANEATDRRRDDQRRPQAVARPPAETAATRSASFPAPTTSPRRRPATSRRPALL